MPDTKTLKTLHCFEAGCGSVTATFDPNRQRGMTITARISGGGLQEVSMSKRQAISTYLVLGRTIRALRDDGQLSDKYVALLDGGSVSWRRFAAQPASDKTGGPVNA